MGSAIIYSVYKDGKYIGEFLGEDIRKDLSMSRASFYQAVNEDRVIRGHYRIIPSDTILSKGSPLLMEFELTRKDILKKAGRA